MKSALILIDIQNDYFPGGKKELYHAAQAGTCARQVLDYFRKKNMPRFFIQHVSSPSSSFFQPDTEGVKIHPCVAPLRDEKVIIKHAPSSFLGTTLLEELQKLEITNLVFVGMMSHMCVDTTVRVAKELGFSNTLLADACTTCDMIWQDKHIPAEMVHNAFMGSLDGYFAKVIPTAQYLKDVELA
jgi:nicotinamidase-related amidase